MMESDIFISQIDFKRCKYNAEGMKNLSYSSQESVMYGRKKKSLRKALTGFGVMEYSICVA